METSGKTVVVTTDGSKAAAEAYATAASMARDLGAKLAIVRVVLLEPAVWVQTDPVKREEAIQARLRSVQSDLQADATRLSADFDIKVDTMVRTLGERWSVAGEILAAADEVDARLICVATRGESEIRHFFVGSTAMNLLAASTRPLMLVRVD